MSNKTGKVIIIAEAGVNHNGSLELAKKMIDVAASAGVDYVKFQTFKTDLLVNRNAPKASYQKNNFDDGSNSQYDMLKKFELTESMHDQLIKYCQVRKVAFLSTAFDNESIGLLKRKGITIGKIPSGEINNLPYLRLMAENFEQLIVSTGMCIQAEVELAINALIDAGASRKKISLLHCNTEYPTPWCDVNLRAMKVMGEKLGLIYGYSDHTLGIEVPIAAVALGAQIIEKHFTLNRNMDGPDHLASLEPEELKMMVSAIRHIELALGSDKKEVSASEFKNRDITRKSIVANSKISKGETITAEKLTCKRPGTGVSPMLWDAVVGTIANRDYNIDEQIVL